MLIPRLHLLVSWRRFVADENVLCIQLCTHLGGSKRKVRADPLFRGPRVCCQLGRGGRSSCQCHYNLAPGEAVVVELRTLKAVLTAFYFFTIASLHFFDTNYLICNLGNMTYMKVTPPPRKRIGPPYPSYTHFPTKSERRLYKAAVGDPTHPKCS